MLRFYGTINFKILPMHKTVTFSDLILLAYNEIPCKDQLYLKEETRFNQGLQEIYEDIVFIQQLINDSASEPSDYSVDRILNYSYAVDCLKIPDPVGDVFIVSN